MIITFTPNPALDKTVYVDNLEPGALNKITRSVSSAGGKGINGSGTLKMLGKESTATGLLAGSVGKMIATDVKARKIDSVWTFIDGETRTNMKIVDSTGCLTELNEPGPDVSVADWGKVRKTLAYAIINSSDDKKIIGIAGSFPPSVTPKMAYELVTELKSLGAKVFLDTSGAHFKEAILAGAHVVKPNAFELSEFYGLNEADLDQNELIALAKKFRKEYNVTTLALSCGAKGAIFACQDKVYVANGIDLEDLGFCVKSSVGAGDSMFATLMYGEDSSLTDQETFKLSVAVSAATCTTLGTEPPSRALVDKLLSVVKLEEF
ncbi:MAG: 1-phosphofructokinase family hexose kinase [Bifidobacteriaceae bacterium]|jgi:1-phosphofructokinase|nr:1-phosphofructokinase family hexose kinase [Bifidobacteriaceae bacterium]